MKPGRSKKKSRLIPFWEVVQFGGARLLTSRLARTLAPPKMQTVPLPHSAVDRAGSLEYLLLNQFQNAVYENLPPRLYADRVARCHRHHRNSGWPALAGAGQSKDERTDHPMRQQSQADGPGALYVRE